MLGEADERKAQCNAGVLLGGVEGEVEGDEGGGAALADVVGFGVAVERAVELGLLEPYPGLEPRRREPVGGDQPE